jgi:hypothetical protein
MTTATRRAPTLPYGTPDVRVAARALHAVLTDTSTRPVRPPASAPASPFHGHPQADVGLIDTARRANGRRLASNTLAARCGKIWVVRQPLPKLTVVHATHRKRTRLRPLIADEINVKAVSDWRQRIRSCDGEAQLQDAR